MKPLSAFLPYIVPYAIGVAEPTAKQALVSAAIEFCEKTNVLQRTLDPIDTVANEPERQLPVPRHQTVGTVLSAWFKDGKLTPIAQADVQAVQAYRQNISGVTPASGDPREIYHLGGARVGLYPVPTTSEDNVITVRAAMKPTRTALQLEDVLFEDWAEVLAAGALHRLHAIPGQPYTDVSRSLQRSLEFRAGVNRAHIESSTGRVQGELRVQMRPLA